jgi:hypothetical protein
MTKTHIIRSVIYGLIFWFFAAMFVKFMAPFFDGGLFNAIILAVSIPLSWLTIPVSLMVTQAPPILAVKVNTIAIIAATFADGLGITFAPDLLYAGKTLATQNGAAFILWGICWILLFAFLRERRV